MWSVRVLHKTTHAQRSGVDSNISTLFNRWARLLWLRLPLKLPDSRCVRPGAGRLPPAPLTRSTLLPAYFPTCLWIIVTEPRCCCSWANCSTFFICFMFPVWGKKKPFFSPLHLLSSLPRLYHSSGSFFTTAYRKDILWRHFSLSRNKYINKPSCLWVLFKQSLPGLTSAVSREGWAALLHCSSPPCPFLGSVKYESKGNYNSILQTSHALVFHCWIDFDNCLWQFFTNICIGFPRQKVPTLFNVL